MNATEIQTQRKIEAVIFDWAGTIADYGSFAPTQVLIDAFAGFDVPVTLAEARVPMGMAKWKHIQTLGKLPAVAARWVEKYGREMTDADVDAVYAKFMPLQIAKVAEYSYPIAGALEVLGTLRSRGIRIGSCTGYPREVMDALIPHARALGLAPDCVIAADDLQAGARPGPWMALANVIELGIGRVAACVKVDDTGVGMQEGRNAGMWCIGLAVSGNEVGLTRAEWDALEPAEQHRLRAAAEQRLFAAGAHYVVDSVADILPLIDLIEARLAVGERP
ncbi:phosphonoacetaldehyde hydrolase [Niveibacterium umoris]|uniref:Phosphonoacetaldehyde hydrolase n=1 Tax=Niveibacterium umoris TaxID=1193620 RepID=A0A840BML6_9RHOO|nr:phosphonoacetaldehyde hydrolase [Niveibacterium umoris]MBB4013883.1 phosphonoacetaldehyde hydrolase [Niveibacterium umoris]